MEPDKIKEGENTGLCHESQLSSESLNNWDVWLRSRFTGSFEEVRTLRPQVMAGLSNVSVCVAQVCRSRVTAFGILNLWLHALPFAMRYV